jgi:hypothetical protein
VGDDSQVYLSEVFIIKVLLALCIPLLVAVAFNLTKTYKYGESIGKYEFWYHCDKFCGKGGASLGESGRVICR